MTKRRSLTKEEKDLAANLKRIWELKKRELGLTQEIAADRIGWKSQGAVSQFLNAQVPLNTDAMLRFAKLLGVPVTDIDPSMTIFNDPGTHTSNTKPGPVTTGMVPLISFVQAGDLCQAEDPFEPGDAFEYISCPESHSPRTFALTVAGPSMDDGTDEGYNDGEIIFVDPEVRPKHNDDVVVRTTDGNATFKRLQVSPEGKFLIAINPDWPSRIISVPPDTVICGVVIGSYRRRKR